MWPLIIFVLISPVLRRFFQPVIHGGPGTLVLTLYVIAPAPEVTITCFGASQRKKCFQRRSRDPPVDEMERSITPDLIVRLIDGEGQSLGVLIPLLMVHIRDIHLERPGQCLDHPFGGAIFLRPIHHCSTLLLTGNTVECAKEIRHEPRFAIMTNRFARFKSSEGAFLVHFRYCLGRSQIASLSDHAAGEQINSKK